MHVFKIHSSFIIIQVFFLKISGEEEFEDAEEVEAAPTDRLRQMRLDNSNGTHYQGTYISLP